MKIVVNKCYGGFGLSSEALRFLESKYGVNIYKSWDDLKNNKKEEELWGVEDKSFGGDNIFSNAEHFRTDHRIIDVINTLGESANGRFAKLEIIDIPDDVEYEIDDYDGIETIHEVHR